MTYFWDLSVGRKSVNPVISAITEKKVIAHAMYAAGSALPGFEPATFSELEPRHWQYLREKTQSQRDRLRPMDESNLEHASAGGDQRADRVARIDETLRRSGERQPATIRWASLA